MNVLGLSVVTNIVNPNMPMVEVDLDDVIAASKEAIKPLGQLIKGIISNYREI
jgi:purine nucleoside phosphorylase